MLIEQIIEFESSMHEASGRTYVPKTDYFHDKTKISKANLLVNCLVLKTFRRQCASLSLIWATSQNLTPKCKILNEFWTRLEVKEGFVQLAFKSQKLYFKWLWKRAKCDPNGIKIASFSKKLQALCVTRLSCTNLLLNHVYQF